MLKTEQLGSYSKHHDYYQLWVEKKKENQRLISHLLDSKKVITTLHVKLSDILNYIKIFEVNQESVNLNNQEPQSIEESYLYAPANEQNIVSEHNQDPIAPESRSEFVEIVCDHEIAEENASPIPQLQCETILSSSLHPNLALNQKQTQFSTKQMGMRKRTFVAHEDDHKSCDVQEEAESISHDSLHESGNLTMNPIKCFKSEPVTVEDEEETTSRFNSTIDVVLRTPTESMQEMTVQIPKQATPRKEKTCVSTETKLMALQRLDNGESQRKVAKDLGVNQSTVSYWVRNVGLECTPDNREQSSVEMHLDPAFIVSDGQSSMFSEQIPKQATPRKEKTCVSTETKLMALQRLDNGESQRKVARDLGVNQSTVSYWVRNVGQECAPDNREQSSVEMHLDPAFIVSDGPSSMFSDQFICQGGQGNRKKKTLVSAETKLMALQRLNNGESQRKVARDLGVNQSTVSYWVRTVGQVFSPHKENQPLENYEVPDFIVSDGES